jgi:hypothetical protein
MPYILQDENSGAKTRQEIYTPIWETEARFDPKEADCCRRHVSWTLVKGGSPPTTGLVITAEQALGDTNACCDINTLPVRDPNEFVSRQLGEYLEQWERILKGYANETEVKEWLKDGVNVEKYFKNFEGKFKGKRYTGMMPPSKFFQNAKTCENHAQYIANTLEERIKNGSIRLWGRAEELPEMPKVILPMTVEESKIRLCLDSRISICGQSPDSLL